MLGEFVVVGVSEFASDEVGLFGVLDFVSEFGPFRVLVGFSSWCREFTEFGSANVCVLESGIVTLSWLKIVTVRGLEGSESLPRWMKVTDTRNITTKKRATYLTLGPFISSRDFLSWRKRCLQNE